MQIEKGLVLTKTIIKGVVWKVHKSNDRLGISKVKEITFSLSSIQNQGEL